MIYLTNCNNIMFYSFQLAARDLSYIPSHTQDIAYTMPFATQVVGNWLEQEIAQLIQGPITPYVDTNTAHFNDLK